MLRNKKLLFKTLFVMLTMVSLSSCKKGLDLKPADGIIREDYWKTKEQIQAFMMGCYGSLLGNPSNSTSGALVDQLFLWGELRADMLAPSLGTTNEDLEIMAVNTVSSNSIVSWRPVYRTINYCNTLIDYAPTVMSNDRTLTQATLDTYIAEAKALRALLYFYLVRSFGDVPLKIKSTSSDEDIVALPKSTQQQVLEQIVADLNDAELKALPTYGSVASDKGRITRYTINAIQADVYLWMEKDAEALVACDKIINSKRFGLIAPGTAWFNTVYRTGNSNESIFEFQYSNQKLNNFYSMFATGSKRFVAANKVVDEVFGSDPFFKDIRSDSASVRSEDGVIWKYVGSNSSDLIAPSDSYTHWFVYRYADVLLMKAEALAELNRGPEALTIVRDIRNRAGALESTNLNPNPANKEEVARFVLEERSREFMFEGKRWYDVLRYSKRNNYARIDYLLNMVSSTVPANSVRTAQAKMLDHNSHYFPIHQYELQTNKSLVQNPFYK